MLRRERLTAGVRLSEERWAFSTHAGGIVVMRWDGSIERILDDTSGATTRSVNSLFVDREGQLWATSPSHIFRIDLTSGTTVFDPRAGLPALTYDSITKVNDHI